MSKKTIITTKKILVIIGLIFIFSSIVLGGYLVVFGIQYSFLFNPIYPFWQYITLLIIGNIIGALLAEIGILCIKKSKRI